MRSCPDCLGLAINEECDRTSEALAETDAWVVAELLPSQADVGNRMLDVAWSRRPVDRLGRRTDLVSYARREFVQRDPLAARDVVDAPADSGNLESSDVGVDDVLDVGEVSGL